MMTFWKARPAPSPALRVNCYFGCSRRPAGDEARVPQGRGYSGIATNEKSPSASGSFTYEELLKTHSPPGFIRRPRNVDSRSAFPILSAVSPRNVAA